MPYRKINPNNVNKYIKIKRVNMKRCDVSKNRRDGEVPNVHKLLELIVESNNRCKYTNVILSWDINADPRYKGSFDRIDNSKGHVLDNLVVCSVAANKSKHMINTKNMTKPEIISSFISRLENKYGKLDTQENNFKNIIKIKQGHPYTNLKIDGIEFNTYQ